MSIPSFDTRGNLPPGVHFATWTEFVARFAIGGRRHKLISGLASALSLLASAGCLTIYVDGSFVTSKSEPGDFDACWSVESVDVDKLDAVFLTFANGRAAQKERFGGEMFPAELPEGLTGCTFLEFFQVDKETGASKGIVSLALDRTDDYASAVRSLDSHAQDGIKE
jgi:hypothetical protein